MFDLVFNLALMVLGFTALIFVHELGHFLAAKWAGIRTEAFAIGMGPVVLSYRKGVGLRLGSTERDTVRRVNERLRKDGVLASRTEKIIDPDASPDEKAGAANEKNNAKPDSITQQQVFDAMDAEGIGETEYSLRWFPIGGFVKMLGQEDANPQAVSNHPASYQNCPIGKRMIVVSAGVVMNLIFAVLLFVVVFMPGVNFEAPIVGSVRPGSPAAMTLPENAAMFNITEPGLMPGDELRSVDGDPQAIFNDIAIAVAMSRPETFLRFGVDRPGIDETLYFNITPVKDEALGFLSIGIAPATSTRLLPRDTAAGDLALRLNLIGVGQAGVKPGMVLASVNGEPVETMFEVERLIDASGGAPLETEWRTGTGGEPIHATVAVEPQLQRLDWQNEDGRAFDFGLLGLVPATMVEVVTPGSPADGFLQPGDLLVRVAGQPYPRETQVRDLIGQHAGKTLDIIVERNGARVNLTPTVGRNGLLGFIPGRATDRTVLAQTVRELVIAPAASTDEGEADNALETRPSPAAEANPVPGSRLVAVAGESVANWADIRRALRSATESALAQNEGARLAITVQLPVEGSPRETVTLNLLPRDVERLHELGWTSDLLALPTEPVYTRLTAEGDPFRAVAMGFDRTVKFVLDTYLTIDRLFRGSVGVEQLRGPVGIVHLGVQVADRGMLYLLFLLAVISVNLAVINFLPLPIVDGGLFLFLIYEKIKGAPPSIAFQNFATIAGLVLIGAIFLITFYNDVMRLVGGG